MKGLGKLLEKKYGELVFGLTCGVGYFVLVLRIILDYTETGGGLLAFFFAPAIICLPAVALIKATRNLKDNEKYSTINTIIILHILLLVVAAVMAVDMIIR